MAASIIIAEVPRFCSVSDLGRHMLRDNVSPAAASCSAAASDGGLIAWAGFCKVRRHDEITRCPALPRL
jgi:hypothetical protein